MSNVVDLRRYKRVRRFEDHNRPGDRPVAGLAADHPAVLGATTRYPATLVHPSVEGRVLKSGFNNTKIGGEVLKGKWAGMPIFTLTLEERATCPSTCKTWRTCYGNTMHWSHRLIHGPSLEARLALECVGLAETHPDGFVVRLHVLGDFYSVGYVHLWRLLLHIVPALHVFGFTARVPGTDIGDAVQAVRAAHPDRFWIRTSNYPSGLSARTVSAPLRATDSINCPEQAGRTDCCGTCGLCWTTTKRINFVEH